MVPEYGPDGPDSPGNGRSGRSGQFPRASPGAPPRYPDRSRRAGPQGSGALPCAPARDPREILAGPSRPCAHLSNLGSIACALFAPSGAQHCPKRTPQQPRIHRPIGVIRGPGSEVQADIGPGSLRAPPLKTTCKPMSARLRMNFSCPGPRARGGAPRRGAIDAKSGEPLTPSLPLRAGVPRDPGAGSRRLRPLGGRYSIMVHEEGERPFERCRYRARAAPQYVQGPVQIAVHPVPERAGDHTPSGPSPPSSRGRRSE